MAEAGFFDGLEPRWLGWDHQFRVYVLPDAIAATYLAGQVYDQPSGRVLAAAPTGGGTAS